MFKSMFQPQAALKGERVKVEFEDNNKTAQEYDNSGYTDRKDHKKNV